MTRQRPHYPPGPGAHVGAGTPFGTPYRAPASSWGAAAAPPPPAGPLHAYQAPRAAAAHDGGIPPPPRPRPRRSPALLPGGHEVHARTRAKRDVDKPANLPDPPAVIVDPATGVAYHRHELLGTGGFARVYRVTNDHGDEFALKVTAAVSVPRPKDVLKVQNERVVQRKLHHPNVVQYLGHFDGEGHYYLLLELCHGRSLYDLLRRRKQLNEIETRYFIEGLITALEYLHSMRIVHRDLKLANLFMDRDLQLKVGDFGLAAELANPIQRKRTVCGTLNYIAPEVLLDAKGHSFEVDIYGVGVIMYTLLVGRPPFASADRDAIRNNILLNRYQFPPNFPTDAQHLITQLLHLDPESRPSLADIRAHPFMTTTPVLNRMPETVWVTPTVVPRSRHANHPTRNSPAGSPTSSASSSSHGVIVPPLSRLSGRGRVPLQQQVDALAHPAPRTSPPPPMPAAAPPLPRPPVRLGAIGGLVGAAPETIPPFTRGSIATAAVPALARATPRAVQPFRQPATDDDDDGSDPTAALDASDAASDDSTTILESRQPPAPAPAPAPAPVQRTLRPRTRTATATPAPPPPPPPLRVGGPVTRAMAARQRLASLAVPAPNPPSSHSSSSSGSASRSGSVHTPTRSSHAAPSAVAPEESSPMSELAIATQSRLSLSASPSPRAWPGDAADADADEDPDVPRSHSRSSRSHVSSSRSSSVRSVLTVPNTPRRRVVATAAATPARGVWTVRQQPALPAFVDDVEESASDGDDGDDEEEDAARFVPAVEDLEPRLRSSSSSSTSSRLSGASVASSPNVPATSTDPRRGGGVGPVAGRGSHALHRLERNLEKAFRYARQGTPSSLAKLAALAETPSAMPEHIVQVLDHSSQWGIGFRTSSGALGIAFLDLTVLVAGASSDPRIEYVTANRGRVAFTAESVPPDLVKYMTLLKVFRDQMGAKPMASPLMATATPAAAAAAPLTIVRKFYQLPEGILMFLNGGTVQVNFAHDKSMLVFPPGAKQVWIHDPQAPGKSRKRVPWVRFSLAELGDYIELADMTKSMAEARGVPIVEVQRAGRLVQRLETTREMLHQQQPRRGDQDG
ncbi:Cell cycle serine/threonine-protein kinase cdc5/MSD2 [Allomyces javanicus]|nr:Cell cycle serine/threonine-protein kinase cdc5/MSD2 [Allomyces javanicus]